jgi:hypothetical protein
MVLEYLSQVFSLVFSGRGPLRLSGWPELAGILANGRIGALHFHCLCVAILTQAGPQAGRDQVFQAGFGVMCCVERPEIEPASNGIMDQEL